MPEPIIASAEGDGKRLDRYARKFPGRAAVHADGLRLRLTCERDDATGAPSWTLWAESERPSGGSYFAYGPAQRVRDFTADQVAAMAAGQLDQDAPSSAAVAEIRAALQDLMAAEGGEPDDQNPAQVAAWNRAQRALERHAAPDSPSLEEAVRLSLKWAEGMLYRLPVQDRTTSDRGRSDRQALETWAAKLKAALGEA